MNGISPTRQRLLVGAGLFTALETMGGVPPTNAAVDRETGDSYRDRWA
jgi:hypothetical protein